MDFGGDLEIDTNVKLDRFPGLNNFVIRNRTANAKEIDGTINELKGAYVSEAGFAAILKKDYLTSELRRGYATNRLLV